MRSFFLLVACLASLNPTWAKDEFLLRNLIPADYSALALDAAEPSPTIAVLLYSTESGKWLPPLTWESPRNLLAVSLESTKPHFVRLVYKENKVDLGYADFHRVIAKRKQPPIFALYLSKQRRVLAENQEVTKRVVEHYTKNYEVQVPVTKQIAREIQATDLKTGEPQNITVTLPVQSSVMEQRYKTTSAIREIRERAPAGTVIEDELVMLGVQEYLTTDRNSLVPLDKPPAKPLPNPLPAGQATFRLLQLLPEGVGYYQEQSPFVRLWEVKDKSWLTPVPIDPNSGLSAPVPLNAGLHFLRVGPAKHESDIGYIDFEAVIDEQKYPLFVLETLKERLQVRKGEYYLRAVTSVVEFPKTYKVQVPVTLTREVPATDPTTGKTIGRPEQFTKYVEEERTTVQRIPVIKMETTLAEKNEPIEQEVLRLSFLVEYKVDRQQKAPAQAHPALEPEAIRARLTPLPSPPLGQPSFTPPGLVPAPPPSSFLPPPGPGALPTPDVNDY
jgi:hypothetical protein